VSGLTPRAIETVQQEVSMSHGDEKDPTKQPPPEDSSGEAELSDADAALAAAEAAAQEALRVAEEARRKAEALALRAAQARGAEPKPPPAPPVSTTPPVPSPPTAAAPAAPPAQVSEPPELGPVKAAASPSSAATSAAKPAAARATRPVPAEGAGQLEIAPNAEGLFGTDAIDERAGEAFVPELPYLRERRSRNAFIAIAVAAGLILGGITFLIVDSEANARMKWFFHGTACAMDPVTYGPVLPDLERGEPRGNQNCLRLYVAQEYIRELERRRAEEYRSRHIYGGVDLTYFPQDARVDIYQLGYVQDGKAWSRGDAGQGEMICDERHPETNPEIILTPSLKGQKRCERPIPNATANLDEGQYLTRLPLKDLALFETDKCTSGSDLGWNEARQDCSYGGETYELGAVIKAYTYEYRLVFSKEGYEPREVVWRFRDWTRSPGAYLMEWSGLDLVPRPETRLNNYAHAERDLFCYQLIQEVTLDAIPQASRDMIYRRNGFKSDEDFSRSAQTLQRGEFGPWYQQLVEQITKLDKRACEEGGEIEVPAYQ